MDKIIGHLLEAEEPDYIVTKRELRPEAQARLQTDYDRIFGATEGDIGYTHGSRTYYREGGKWYEEIKRKNPAYWDQPNYFIIYPGPDPYAFIVAKHPRRLTQKNFQKAISQIFRDATGLPYTNDHFGGVDGTDEGVFNARVGGEKPEPAYEVFIDGTWKRLK